MPARLRPPADDDAEAVLAVIVARDVADLGVPDFTLEDLQADWASLGLIPVELAGSEGTGQRVAVLDAGVHALASRRTVHVCGVAGEQEAACREVIRDPMVDPEPGGPDEFGDLGPTRGALIE